MPENTEGDTGMAIDEVNIRVEISVQEIADVRVHRGSSPSQNVFIIRTDTSGGTPISISVIEGRSEPSTDGVLFGFLEEAFKEIPSLYYEYHVFVSYCLLWWD